MYKLLFEYTSKSSNMAFDAVLAVAFAQNITSPYFLIVLSALTKILKYFGVLCRLKLVAGLIDWRVNVAVAATRSC